MHFKPHVLHARTNLVARPNEAGLSQFLNWQCRVYKRSSTTEVGHILDYGQVDASDAQHRGCQASFTLTYTARLDASASL